MDVQALNSKMFAYKDNSYGHLEENKPTVIFMDGVGVTRNHIKYNMFSDDSYTFNLVKAGIRMLDDWSIESDWESACTMYASIDEISFVFPDTQALIQHFEMDNTASYILSIFTQYFLRFFWDYPGCKDSYLKTTIFNIGAGEEDEWIRYRQDINNHNAIDWMAKEFLPTELYHGLDTEGKIQLLKDHDLWDKFCANKALYDGIKLYMDGKPLASLR